LGLAERIQRFARSSSGIEASTQAYFETNSAIEKQLMKTTNLRSQPWTIQSASAGTISNGTGFYLQVSTGSVDIPKKGTGNSPFDKDKNYNLITLSEPVQLVIPENVQWGDVNIEFRVPDLDGDGELEKSSNVSTKSGAVLWTFGSQSEILYASGETQIVTFGDITHKTDKASKKFKIGEKLGYLSSDASTGKKFSRFYNDLGDKCKDYKCTLKFSMIRRIPIAGDKELPFLEYKISFDNITAPNRYMKLDSSAFVRGYLRSRHVEIPQITSNTALDFAVLQ
ncbi:hypothetical protein KGV55_03885, partial [Candidatus Gracilibacteria bacterium]|nr:hypothetical protein [Candidatus Gracilibacteria bacterium]